MTTHYLKILPIHYSDVVCGVKTAEVRLNDRDFRKGDTLVLKEHDVNGYTGRSTIRVIVGVSDVSFIKKGMVLLSMAAASKTHFEKLRALMGYVQNGTDACITVFQDDATRSYGVSCSLMGRRLWCETEDTLEMAIDKAYLIHHVEG